MERDASKPRTFEEALDTILAEMRAVMIERQLKYGSNNILDGAAGFRQFKQMIEHLAAGRYSLAAGEMTNSKWYYQVGTRARRLVEMIRTGEDYTN